MKKWIVAGLLSTLMMAGTPRLPPAHAKPSAANRAKLQKARAQYERVTGNLKRYRLVKRTLDDGIEGGEVEVYYSGQAPVYLVVNNYGETGRARNEYAWENNRVFFAMSTQAYYREPLFAEPRTVPPGTVKKRTDERFYFDGGVLYHRTVTTTENNRKRVVTSNGTNAAERQAAGRVLSEARKLLKIAQSPA